MTKILFIGSRLFDDVSYYCKENNIETIVTESNKNAENLKDADKVYIVSRGMDEPYKIALSEDVDGVIPLIGIDPPLVSVSLMKEKLEDRIPVLISNKNTVEICSDKIKTKEFFVENNIPTPNFKVLGKEDDFSNLSFPLVLKQASGQGGLDIKICKSISELDEYFENFDIALCEEFILGSELSIEVSVWNGIYYPLVPIYKGETSIDGVHPIGRLRYGPAIVKNLDNSRVVSLAVDIASKLDAEGTIDIDLIYDPISDKLYALEVNTRVSGTRYLSSATTGINPLINLIKMVTGDFSYESMSSLRGDYSSVEIPVKNYKGSLGDEPLKDFVNKPFVVHGPENYQRLTIRGKSSNDCFDIAYKLTGIDYKP